MVKDFGTKDSGVNSNYFYRRFNYRTNIDFAVTDNLSMRLDISSRFMNINEPCNMNATGEIYDFSKMHISYLPNSGDYINDEKEIEIEFQYDNEESDFPELMEKNLDAMGIKEAYNMHKDYLLEILRKGQIYSAEQRESIMQDFPDLFSSDEELIRTIFGNYIREEELLKRPLSKLTRDILEELGLISNI